MNTQEELVFQVKNMLGIIAILFDHMPQYAQFHMARVSSKLLDALCKFEGIEDLGVNEVQTLATKDVLKDWQKDGDMPSSLGKVVDMLLDELNMRYPEDEGQPAYNMTDSLDTIADRLLNDEEDTKESPDNVDISIWDIWNNGADNDDSVD